MQCDQPRWPASADAPNAAGFREIATIGPHLSFFRIPDDTPSEAVIAFGCAMPTALAGFRRLGKIPPMSTVLVQGCGPVGLASTFLARLSGSAQVIVVGGPDHRRQAATRLGATTVIDIDLPAESRKRRVHELTGGLGVDVVIEAAGHVSAFSEGLEVIATNGRQLILGLFSGDQRTMFDPVQVNVSNLTIIGSFGSEPEDYLDTVRLAALHDEDRAFSDLVTHRFGLDGLGEAIECAGSGEAVKAVVEMALT